jgi:hypothetical protein
LVHSCPSIPRKSFFKVSSEEAIFKRKTQLEQFLKECITRKDIFNSQAFQEFIEIDKHSPEILTHSPALLTDFQDLALGVRDFIYLKHEGILILACSNMNITSRVKSYITNVNMSWESTEPLSPVGTVIVYKVSALAGSNGNHYSHNKIWSKNYSIQIRVICWDYKTNTLAVGLDNGKVNIFKAQIEGNFIQFNEVNLKFKFSFGSLSLITTE